MVRSCIIAEHVEMLYMDRSKIRRMLVFKGHHDKSFRGQSLLIKQSEMCLLSFIPLYEVTGLFLSPQTVQFTEVIPPH